MYLRTLFLIVFALLSMSIAAGPFEDAQTAHDNADYATAIRLWRPLADQGDARAQAGLGSMYFGGHGVPRDFVEAAKWFRKAAEQRLASAEDTLALMYSAGIGVRQNSAEAAKWYRKATESYRKAADQGDAKAQARLGQMYHDGLGVPQDYTEAVKWHTKAADQGNADEQVTLGLMYAKGDGVPRDYVAAVKWYRKAADQSNAAAQINLGFMYETGQGVVQNFVLAHMWYNLASAQGLRPSGIDLAGESRDNIARKMTPQQIEQAQALAAKWQPNSGEPKDISNNSGRGFQPLEIESTGTGFFVSRQGYVLTNHHVIEGCASVRLRLPGQSSHEATLVARDSNNDLALLKSDSRPDLVASLSSRKRPQLGQSAIIFGFPLTGVLSSSGNLTTGTVSALSGLQDDSRVFQISAPVQPGNSGGPVLDASGAVIGVVVSKLNARAVEKAIADIPQNVNFAIKGAVAVGFLDNNGVDYVTDADNQTIPVEEIAKRAMRFTVLVECLK